MGQFAKHLPFLKVSFKIICNRLAGMATRERCCFGKALFGAYPDSASAMLPFGDGLCGTCPGFTGLNEPLTETDDA